MMITEAIVRKDGIFVKGFKPSTRSGKITVHVEQLNSGKLPSCRGILSRYANKKLIPTEKDAWRKRVRDE